MSKEIENEMKLHKENVKSIQDKMKDKGLFLTMVCLNEEDERHEKVMKELKEQLQEILQATPTKVTTFKATYPAHTFFKSEFIFIKDE